MGWNLLPLWLGGAMGGWRGCREESRNKSGFLKQQQWRGRFRDEKTKRIKDEGCEGGWMEMIVDGREKREEEEEGRFKNSSRQLFSD